MAARSQRSPLPFTAATPPRIYTLSLHDALPICSSTFVAVTGDLRRDLFRHLTGQSPSYFADRGPGTLSSRDRKSTRLNSSHANISYAVFCLKKKREHDTRDVTRSKEQTYHLQQR